MRTAETALRSAQTKAAEATAKRMRQERLVSMITLMAVLRGVAFQAPVLVEALHDAEVKRVERDQREQGIRERIDQFMASTDGATILREALLQGVRLTQDNPDLIDRKVIDACPKDDDKAQDYPDPPNPFDLDIAF